MSGTDDRTPGSIEDLALSWGLSPEQARRVAATAAALAAGTYPTVEYVPPQCGHATRIPAQRRPSPVTRAADDTAADEPV